jgi:hypothetical protein
MPRVCSSAAWVISATMVVTFAALLTMSDLAMQTQQQKPSAK